MHLLAFGNLFCYQPVGQIHKTFVTLTILILSIHFCPIQAFGYQRSLSQHQRTTNWLPVSTPEEQGMNSESLIKMFDYIEKNRVNIHNITIIRNDHIVLNADFYPYRQAVVHDVASVTKSITSTLIGIAIDKGFIPNVDTPVLKFFPEVNSAPVNERLQRLTIRHLLTMTSGFCRSFGDGERQLDVMRRADDTAAFILQQAIATEPGQEFAYCSMGTHLLSIIITRATGRNALQFARHYLFGPLGIRKVIWPADLQGNSNGWGDFFICPSDLAKIGYLYLRNGDWNGKQLLSKDWIKQATTRYVRVSEDEEYGYLWWFPGELAGLYEARGRGDQRLVVWPEKNLVVVMLGSGFEPGEVGSFIVNALKSQQTLSPNRIAYEKLQRKILAAMKVLPPDVIKPLSDKARTISGKTFLFEPNEMGLKSFQLNFNNKDIAVLTLSLAVKVSQEFGVRRSLIGLNGRYSISPSSRFNLPLAAKGSWYGDNIFELIYYEFAGNHLWNITMEFEGDEVRWHLMDRAGWVNTSIKAQVKK
ncbi:MAG: serine hydrolase [Acidobacteriota bacterium]